MRLRMRTDYPAILRNLLIDLGVTQTQLSARLGTSQSSISRCLAGGAIKSDLANKIEDLAQSVYNRETDGELKLTYAKVVGRIGAGAEIMPEFEQVPPEGLFEVELPFAVREGSVAFEIVGDSMWPRLNEGDVIICDGESFDRSSWPGTEAAVDTEDGRRYFKTIAATADPDLFDLMSYNAATVRNVRLRRVCKLAFIVVRGQWREKSREPRIKRLTAR